MKIDHPAPCTRTSGRVRFFWGDPAKQFSFSDPECVRVQNALHDLRYGDKPNLDAAGLISDYLYLLLGCPTTKLAQKKLAMMRRALRES